MYIYYTKVKGVFALLLQQVIEKFKEYLDVQERSPETISSYMKDLKSFETFIVTKYNGPVYFSDITAKDIDEYLKYLKEERKLSPASRSRNLYTLRSLYNFACKKDLCQQNIANKIEPIKIRQKERVYLTPKEVEELVNAIDHFLIKVVVQTLYYTGMRISECLNLKIDDLDFKNNIIHIKKGKGNKDRDIPINSKLKSILQEYWDKERKFIKSPYFFATEKTGRLSSVYVNTVLHQTTDKLNWTKKVTAHTLRHSFASNLVLNDISLVNIQRLLGHSNLKITSIYTHTNMDELSKAVNSLN